MISNTFAKFAKRFVSIFITIRRRKDVRVTSTAKHFHFSKKYFIYFSVCPNDFLFLIRFQATKRVL